MQRVTVCSESLCAASYFVLRVTVCNVTVCSEILCAASYCVQRVTVGNQLMWASSYCVRRVTVCSELVSMLRVTEYCEFLCIVLSKL